MSGLVSVITPVFNREDMIGKALMSIQTQTYRNWEVIAVDDGSTDQTPQIVKNYAQHDRRIHLLRHSRCQGAQAARNTGIHAARGEWITFLDSDDRWLPESLEIRLRLAMAQGLEVVHSECFVMGPGMSEPERFGVPPIQGQAYRQLLRRPGPMFQGLLVSRNAMQQIGDLDESIRAFQEWDTAIRLASQYSFGFVSEPTFIWDCSQSQTISKNVQQNATSYEQVFTKHRWAILRQVGPQTLAAHYEACSGLYLNAGQSAEALRCLLLALFWWPLVVVRWLVKPGILLRCLRQWMTEKAWRPV